MTEGSATDNLAVIRDLLRAAFTPRELRRFWHDRPLFRPIVDEFGHGLNDMIDRVVDYCQARVLWDAFLGTVETEYPEQHARFAAKLGRRAPASALPPPGGPTSGHWPSSSSSSPPATPHPRRPREPRRRQGRAGRQGVAPPVWAGVP
jgi:hypothetical protein